MFAGKYRHKINVVTRELGRDENLDPIDTFPAVVSDLPCLVVYNEQKEQADNSFMDTVGSLEITCRYRDTIKSDMYVQYRDVIYKIESAVPVDPSFREMVIYATKSIG